MFLYCVFFIDFLSSFALILWYIDATVQCAIDPKKAEITEDKGMYSRASEGLGGPQAPA